MIIVLFCQGVIILTITKEEVHFGKEKECVYHRT